MKASNTKQLKSIENLDKKISFLIKENSKLKNSISYLSQAILSESATKDRLKNKALYDVYNLLGVIKNQSKILQQTCDDSSLRRKRIQTMIMDVSHQIDVVAGVLMKKVEKLESFDIE